MERVKWKAQALHLNLFLPLAFPFYPLLKHRILDKLTVRSGLSAMYITNPLKMNKKFDFVIDKSQFPEDAEFAFTLKRFSRDIVAARTFSSKNSISCLVDKPGMYHADCIIKTGSSLACTSSGHSYFPPEVPYDLFDRRALAMMERTIYRDWSKDAIECFQVDANSQIHDFIYFPSRKQKLFCPLSKRDCPRAISCAIFLSLVLGGRGQIPWQCNRHV